MKEMEKCNYLSDYLYRFINYKCNFDKYMRLYGYCT